MQITANGIAINCRLDGPEDAPVLAFSNSLATSFAMWDGQAEHFAGPYRVLRYDNRGHGDTPPVPGPYTIETLARDFVGILDALEIDKVHFCGLSMGGMVGQWLGINAPERVHRIVLSNTTSYFPDKEMWRERIEMARKDGIGAIAEASIRRWFTPEYVADAGNAAVLERARGFINKTTREGYLECCAAIRDMDFRAELGQIRVPALVIIGERDPATTPEYGEVLAAGIPGSQTTVIAGAAHLSNIEQAETFDATLGRFLEG